MRAVLRRAIGLIAAATVVVTLAAGPGQAQRRDHENWIAPPLKAIGKAIGRVGRGADRLVPPAVKPKRAAAPKGQGARKRPAQEIKARPSQPAAKGRTAIQQARLPRARPADMPGKLIPPVAQGGAPPSPTTSQREVAVAAKPDGAGTSVAAVPAPPAAASMLATTPPPFPEGSANAEAGEGLARLPHARPAADVPAAPEVARVEPAAPEPARPTAPAPAVSAADERACLARLGALGVVFQVVPPIDPDGQCPVPAPLELTSLGSGVAINPKAVLNCRTAEALALWVRDAVIPAAQAELQAVPTEITESSSYVCRTRNNEPGAKMSEHASANAVDIGAIGFAHRPPYRLAKGVPDTPDGRFQAAIQEGACRFFTTVLAPGSDASHPDHMHLDMAERRDGYRICDLDPAETAVAEPPNTKRE